MRVAFMGTPPAAVPSLAALAEQHDVVAVYTQPDRPRGRGRRTAPSPVKEAATRLGFEVVEPETLKGDEEVERLRSFAPDVVAVVAYGQILTAQILTVPRLGCVNVHFSLLPRWRGAAPVERAIMAGDDVTGVTTMLMDPGLDTGPALLRAEEAIGPQDSAGTLTERLAQLGAGLLVRTLEGLEGGTVEPRPQPEDGVTYAKKITSEDAWLDLREPATGLWLRIRALDPHPGAYTTFRDSRLKVWAAEPHEGDGEPGTVVAVDHDAFAVQTGEGRLRLLEVQPEGKKRLSAAEFVRGYRPQEGERVGASATR